MNKSAEITTAQSQKVNLIEGSFTAAEASDLIRSLIDVKLNFHTLNRLSITEKDHSDLCIEDSSRIEELLKEKKAAKAFFKQLRKEDKKISISSSIHIEVED